MLPLFEKKKAPPPPPKKIPSDSQAAATPILQIICLPINPKPLDSVPVPFKTAPETPHPPPRPLHPTFSSNPIF